MKKLVVVGLMMSNLVFAQSKNDTGHTEMYLEETDGYGGTNKQKRVKVEVTPFEGTKKEVNPFKKGSVMVFWGWNFSTYSNSDIRFKGNGYDFQLSNVVANDRPTAFSFNKYFNPGNVTIPQVNYRITYFPSDNFGITLGMDHMKYVMDQNQTVDFKGYINDPKYAAMVQNGKVDLSNSDFLTFEHTDGLNYINIGAQKYKQILDKKNIDLFWSYGGGIGALLPKSNVQLMGNERSDRFHLAGFGVDARTALSLVAWRHIVVQVEGKFGYINMPDIKTTLNNKPDKASQDFVYGEVDFGIGYTFNTRKYN
ncbi:MAG: hypothetical protein LBE92_21590 [Chryseobacterium sp.]|jgi:hypothetical protein|uniref:hypothetical protein n=1 Tax=Chryseobacterium sp. TaxID=1871047 RepID=UPI002828F3E3|nr:hypothetical protein [Chryseobacterium sp.]MDR2238715.1 hypothetical protein [Chryseobacterium sp.]